MINEQIINLLTSGAAIITIISGLNGFLGNKYNNLSKKVFNFAVISLLFVFVKEIICLFYGALPVITVFSAFVILFFCFGNRDNENLKKQSIFTLVMIFLVIVMITNQKNIINFWITDYGRMFNDYIEKLNGLVKIIEIYKFIFSTSNIVYTFSNFLNMVITILCFYLIYRVKNYLNNKDLEIDKILCYAIFLFTFSCGCGTLIMNEIVKKF